MFPPPSGKQGARAAKPRRFAIERAMERFKREMPPWFPAAAAGFSVGAALCLLCVSVAVLFSDAYEYHASTSGNSAAVVSACSKLAALGLAPELMAALMPVCTDHGIAHSNGAFYQALSTLMTDMRVAVVVYSLALWRTFAYALGWCAVAGAVGAAVYGIYLISSRGAQQPSIILLGGQYAAGDDPKTGPYRSIKYHGQ
jgi:hypothetical protein